MISSELMSACGSFSVLVLILVPVALIMECACADSLCSDGVDELNSLTIQIV